MLVCGVHVAPRAVELAGRLPGSSRLSARHLDRALSRKIRPDQFVSIPLGLAEGLFGEALTVPVDPHRIRYTLHRHFHRRQLWRQGAAAPFVTGGNWRPDLNPVSACPVKVDIVELFAAGLDHTQTPVYADMLERIRVANPVVRNLLPLDSEARVQGYFQHVLRLTESIRTHGVLRRTELAAAGVGADFDRGFCPAPMDNKLRDVGVAVDHDGSFYLHCNGFHRTAIAVSLNLEQLPVQIRRVHSGWLRHLMEASGLPATAALLQWLSSLQRERHTPSRSRDVAGIARRLPLVKFLAESLAKPSASPLDREQRRVVRAQIAMRYARWSQALKLWHRILDENPSHAVAKMKIVDVYLAQGRSGTALDILRRELAHNPDNVGALEQLAAIYCQNGDLPEAIATWRHLLENYDGNDRVFAALSDALSVTGEDSAAVSTLRAGSTSCRGSLLIRRKLARLLTRLNRCDAAVPLWKGLERDDALMAHDRLRFARALRESGDLADAERVLRAALQDDPGDQRVLRNLANLLQHMQHWTTAIPLWQTLSGMRESTLNDHVQYARASLAGGHEREAGRIVDAATQRWSSKVPSLATLKRTFPPPLAIR